MCACECMSCRHRVCSRSYKCVYTCGSHRLALNAILKDLSTLTFENTDFCFMCMGICLHVCAYVTPATLVPTEARNRCQIPSNGSYTQL